jgi:hypothetical protein
MSDSKNRNISKKHTDRLEDLKDLVKRSYDYNRENAERWHEFQKFIYLTSISEDDKEVLKDLNKPQIEFNILEAYISRLCGEFSKQQPSIEAYTIGSANVQPQTLEIVEGYYRNMEYEARHNGTANKIYRDQLGGGFSVAKVWTEYASPNSFQQAIRYGRVFDPTLTGFDPMAKESHKGDGKYSFEIFPQRRADVEKKYGVDLGNLGYTSNLDGFSWSYKTNSEEIVLVADFYEKQMKRVRINQLANGMVVTDKEYEELQARWEMMGQLTQVPAIVNRRWTDRETIMRHVFCENQLLCAPKVTNFGYLPHVFFDGNSVTIRKTLSGTAEQYTRPYIYQAKGAQRLKNFAGQTLANELENLVQHKFMVPVEAIPPEYKDAYTDTQIPNVLVYNQFKDNDPNVRLDPPREIGRPPIPAEIAGAFTGSDSVVQGILGSYDASLGINNNQLSGVAIVEGATQSNAAAMPYVVNYLAGLTQIGRIVMDLIPKYVVTPSTVPIVGKDGKRHYQKVNAQGQPSMQYDAQALGIKVEAGVNFEIQKDKNMKMLQQIMQMSPMFSQFISTQGLPILLDNVDIKGADQLKEMAEQFVQQQAQQQQPPNPQLISAQAMQQKVQQDGQLGQANVAIKQAQLQQNETKLDNDRMNIMIQAGDNKIQNDLAQEKMDAERSREVTDLALKTIDQDHRHAKETAETIHKIKKGNQVQ